MSQDVFAVEQSLFVDDGIESSELFFVDGNATALGHFAHFALRGENGSMVGEQIYGADAGAQGFFRDFKSGNTFEHVEEGLFVELSQLILRGVTEQNAGSFHGLVVVFFAVNHDGNILGQALLQQT